ncbi:hypothetical protein ACFQZ1_07970 [Bacillus sp. CGMCC 1.60114]|uniref:hypothetical protein n=1 Tax=unclassified Bacillus (in: firmicutes) TaxID=185979 RepID=UPI003634885D
MDMRYFEFDKHEYYALMAVKDGGLEKAIDLYVEIVAGENAEEVKAEALPTEITRNQALTKYVNAVAEICPNKKISEFVKEFNEYEDGPMLVSGALI